MNMTNLKRLIMLNILLSAAFGLSMVNAAMDHETKVQRKEKTMVEAKPVVLSAKTNDILSKYTPSTDAEEEMIRKITLIPSKNFIKANDRNMRNYYNQFLEPAVQNGYLAALKMLIDKGIDVNFSNRALTLAVRHGQDNCIRLLCDAGARTETLSNDELSYMGEREPYGGRRIKNVNYSIHAKPLEIAAQMGSIACVRALLESGANETVDATHFDTPADAEKAAALVKKELTRAAIDKEHPVTQLPPDLADIIADYTVE